jgi:hypothetical protein
MSNLKPNFAQTYYGLLEDLQTTCKLSIFIVAYVLECRIRGEIV